MSMREITSDVPRVERPMRIQVPLMMRTNLLRKNQPADVKSRPAENRNTPQMRRQPAESQEHPTVGEVYPPEDVQQASQAPSTVQDCQPGDQLPQSP